MKSEIIDKNAVKYAHQTKLRGTSRHSALRIPLSTLSRFPNPVLALVFRHTSQ